MDDGEPSRTGQGVGHGVFDARFVNDGESLQRYGKSYSQRLAQEMRMAARLAKNVREGRRVSWLIKRRKKTVELGIHLPYLAAGGEGPGAKGWCDYAAALEARVVEQKKRLHGDLRKQMKQKRAGRKQS